MADDPSFNSNYLEGVNRFQGVRSRAFWQEVLSLLRGQSAELLSFDEVRSRLRLHEESYKGIQDVPLDKIVGSVGRYKDFTATFLPKSNDMKDRWSRVYAVANSMQGYPPIELYKVGEVYFVRDGNHRVSVARQLGTRTIEAHVTELPTTVNLKPGMTPADLDAAAEYAYFLEESGLQKVRPNHQSLELSVPSRYNELLGHIYLHARVMEQALGHPVTMADAAANWYDNVYRPAVTLIRKYGVLEQLRNRDRDRTNQRTEADLYLWLVDHLRDVRQQFGDNAPQRKFSDALIDFLGENRIPVPDDLKSEGDQSVILSRTQVMRAIDEKRAEMLRQQRQNAENDDDDT